MISDSTCVTPILNVCSPTASQRSDQSITPIKSNTTTYLTPRSSLTSDTFGDSTSADFYSIVTDSGALNETVTNQSVNSLYETCIGASVRLLESTRSVRARLGLRRLSSDLLNKFPKLQKLSTSRTSQINIPGNQADQSDYCMCEDGLFDENCLRSFMEMSVQPAEYRNNPQIIMTSTPVITKDMYDHSIFNVARIKKVELHELSPKVPEFHGKYLAFFCFYLLRFDYIKFIFH